MSVSLCAVEMNQLWCGCTYTPRAAHAAPNALLRSKPGSSLKLMNGTAGGPDTVIAKP